MADEYDLVKTAKIHGPAEHTHVLLAICCIQSSHRFVPEKSFVMNAVTLPHVVDGDAQVNSFIDQNELATGELVHEASTVQILITDLDIKIVYHPLAVRLGALRPEADFYLAIEGPHRACRLGAQNHLIPGSGICSNRHLRINRLPCAEWQGFWASGTIRGRHAESRQTASKRIFNSL
jgi:hypothetical protein